MLHWAMFGQPDEKYIIGLPSCSTTTGWPSWPRSAPVDCDQTKFSFETFSVLMSLSVEWRVNWLSRPGAGHRFSFLAFFSISAFARTGPLMPIRAAMTLPATKANLCFIPFPLLAWVSFAGDSPLRAFLKPTSSHYRAGPENEISRYAKPHPRRFRPRSPCAFKTVGRSLLTSIRGGAISAFSGKAGRRENPRRRAVFSTPQPSCKHRDVRQDQSLAQWEYLPMSIANIPDHAVVIASRIDGNNAWDFNGWTDPAKYKSRREANCGGFRWKSG